MINWFLGIRIHMDVTTGMTTLNQTQFIIEILQRFQVIECRPRKTPMDKGIFCTVDLLKMNQPMVYLIDKKLEPYFRWHVLLVPISLMQLIKLLLMQPIPLKHLG